MPISVTQADNNDYLWFVEVFKEAEEFHRVNAPWKFTKPEPELFSKNYFEELISAPDYKFSLAKEDGKIVWFIIAFIRKTSPIPLFKKRDWIEVDNLVVKNEYRKQWIGNLLIHEIENRARTCDIADIELNVWDFNKWAIAFYEKWGYEIYSHRMRKTIK